MQAPDELVATAAYQPEPAAAAAARRFVRETLRSWALPGRDDRPDPDELIDDAVLLTSELVTNAVVHAGTSVHVTCRLSAEAVEIVVLDGRPAQLIPDTPRAAPADLAERTSGRGLQLPAQLASAWGVTYAKAAKAVWFRIGLPGLRIGTAADAPGVQAVLDGGASRVGLLARTLAEPDDVPAWARRNLSRVGYEELLSSTAEAARAVVAADVAYLLDAGEDGELRVRAVAGADPAGREPGAPPGGAVRALAGAALSLVTIPLVVDGRVTGVLAVAAAEPDRFGEQDAARLQDLADWSGPPLERARLGELEQGRRDRAAFLAAASEELSVSLDEAKIAAAGASRAIGDLAGWCAVLAAGEGRALRLLHAAHSDPAAQPVLVALLEHVDPPGVPEPELPFRSRAAGWRWQPELPDGMPQCAAALAADPAWCFPLVAADRNLGLLIIGGSAGYWPPREARELAAGLAHRIAVALDNAGRHASHRVSAAGPATARLAAARPELIRRAPGRRAPARQESAGPPPGGR